MLHTHAHTLRKTNIIFGTKAGLGFLIRACFYLSMLHVEFSCKAGEYLE